MPETFVSRSGSLRFHCRMIDIREFSGVELLASDSIHDNFLAILTSDVDQRSAIREVLGRLKELPEKLRGDRLAQLLIILGLRRLEPFFKEEARSIMPVYVDLMENLIIREMVDEASAKARAEAKLEALTASLAHRFGPLPDWAAPKLQAAALPDLERWMIQLLDAHTLEQALS